MTGLFVRLSYDEYSAQCASLIRALRALEENSRLNVRGHEIHEPIAPSLISLAREPQGFLEHNELTNWHFWLGNVIQYRANLRPRLCEDRSCVA